MRFPTLVLAAFLAGFLAAESRAQCANVAIGSYGNTCPFFLQDATLSAAFNTSTCTLDVDLSVSQTCCNTFPNGQILIIGTAPIIPGIHVVPLLPSCELAVVPLVQLPTSVGNGWSFFIPAVPVTATFYLQGVNTYFTTIGFTTDYQSSNGLKLDLS